MSLAHILNRCVQGMRLRERGVPQGGLLQVAIDGQVHRRQVICHCTDCRQSSGSAFSRNILAPKKDVTIAGPVKEFSMKAPSGNTVARCLLQQLRQQTIHRGLFSDFAQIPVNMERAFPFRSFFFVVFSAHSLVIDRWTGIPAIVGAAQFQGMLTA
ncbi:hypothetical protein C8R44DRAFT_886525 [Mycena epipterygia]|nr:hypothetical protein C8R44DRAFT_886525 [Mycena epipterygia]